METKEIVYEITDVTNNENCVRIQSFNTMEEAIVYFLYINKKEPNKHIELSTYRKEGVETHWEETLICSKSLNEKFRELDASVNLLN
jgi:hypothetical protein